MSRFVPKPALPLRGSPSTSSTLSSSSSSGTTAAPTPGSPSPAVSTASSKRLGTVNESSSSHPLDTTAAEADESTSEARSHEEQKSSRTSGLSSFVETPDGAGPGAGLASRWRFGRGAGHRGGGARAGGASDGARQGAGEQDRKAEAGRVEMGLTTNVGTVAWAAPEMLVGGEGGRGEYTAKVGQGPVPYTAHGCWW